jgi:protoheme IX farnesyltransferase
VFNQIIDSRIDQKMARTRGRPIPAGSVPLWQATGLGLVLGSVGTAVLCAEGSPLAAGIALGANLFYVLFYTWFLKMRTVQNIVIGGAAGAVGPLIGSAMVDGHYMGFGPLLLATIIFLWTPPHFWALAIKYRDDYAKAGVPMYPVVKGFPATRSAIWWYTLALLPVVAGLYFVDGVSLFGVASALVFTAVFCLYSWRLYASGDNRHAMPVFHYSCLYLFLLFGCVSMDLFIGLL